MGGHPTAEPLAAQLRNGSGSPERALTTNFIERKKERNNESFRHNLKAREHLFP